VSDPTALWISKRISDARARLGWTQAELAAQLHRTQTAVSYWESGKRKPGLDDVIDLARVLDRDVGYFLPPGRTRQPIAAVLRAELARLGSGDLEQAVDAVLSRTETAEIPEPTIRVGARQPTHAANELLERAKISAPPVPVDELVALCGVFLCQIELPDALSGMIVELDAGPVIAVNANHAPTRQRFSMAHELGHHLLQHTDRFHLDVQDGSPFGFDYAVERAANDFAADLLMPRRFVTHAFESTQQTGQLAEIFDVSEIAMGYRILNLGLR
jgi:transcriptional regulator with XRE-family HTH domain